MNCLRRFFLVILICLLPLHAGMAAVAHISETLAQTQTSKSAGHDIVHEHRDWFGGVELHVHKAVDTAHADTGKSCNSVNGVPVDEYRQPEVVWSVSRWSVTDAMFPNDHPSAPPEQPPRACA